GGAVAKPRDVAGGGGLAGVATRRPGAGGPRILFLCPSGPAARSRAARSVPDPSKADRRLHSRASGDQGQLEGRTGAASLTLGTGAWGFGPGRRLAETEAEAIVDDGPGVHGVAGGDHGARAAVPSGSPGLPCSRDHAGDDLARSGGIPGRGAGRALL